MKDRLKDILESSARRGHSDNHDFVKEVLKNMSVNYDSQRIIHIAGTNGKGSVGTYMSNILQACNYQVGLFTSPHLIYFNERIKVNQLSIEDEILEDIFEEIIQREEELQKKHKRKLTYFEIAFIIAMTYFSKRKMDYVIIEAGIGGKNDATNIFSSTELCIITSLGYDHINVLGKDLESIASHKAGIIKKHSRVVSYFQDPKIESFLSEYAHSLNAESIIFLEKKDIKIKSVSEEGSCFSFKEKVYALTQRGHSQPYNAALALLGIQELGISLSDDGIYSAIKNTKVLGRLEEISDSPRIIVDGAHNEGAIKHLNETIKNISFKRIILILGYRQDKEIDKALARLIAKADIVVFTPFKGDLREDTYAKELQLAQASGIPAYISSGAKESLAIAENNYCSGDLILVTGSFYLAGEIMEIVRGGRDGY